MNKKEVLAVVGDREITQRDVDVVLGNMNPQMSAQFRSEEGRKRLVQELINQELFFLDAIDSKMDETEEFQAELKKAKSELLKQYAINKLLGDVSAAEDELINYYDQNQWQFSTSSSVRASHILVGSADEAEKVFEEINGGLSFEEAAAKYSSCPSKAQGGDLGYFTRGKMVPEFEEAAFDMEKGEISKPVETQFGFHLIKLLDKKEPGKQSFEEVKNDIRQQVVAGKQQDLYFSKVNELKGRYKVEIK